MLSRNHKGEIEMRVGDTVYHSTGIPCEVLELGISGFRYSFTNSLTKKTMRVFCSWRDMPARFPKQAKLVLNRHEMRLEKQPC